MLLQRCEYTTPSRELTYPTLQKENHLQKCIGRGYVSFEEGIYSMHCHCWNVSECITVSCDSMFWLWTQCGLVFAFSGTWSQHYWQLFLAAWLEFVQARTIDSTHHDVSRQQLRRPELLVQHAAVLWALAFPFLLLLPLGFSDVGSIQTWKYSLTNVLSQDIENINSYPDVNPARERGGACGSHIKQSLSTELQDPSDPSCVFSRMNARDPSLRLRSLKSYNI